MLTRKPLARAALIAAPRCRRRRAGTPPCRASSRSPSRWTVQVKVGLRLEQVELLLQQQGVGAQIDELALRASCPRRSARSPCAAAARRRRSRPPARRIRRPPPGTPRPTGGRSGRRRDSRSCRSRRRPGCSGTAAPASAPADSACARRDAGAAHKGRCAGPARRVRSWSLGSWGGSLKRTSSFTPGRAENSTAPMAAATRSGPAPGRRGPRRRR